MKVGNESQDKIYINVYKTWIFETIWRGARAGTGYGTLTSWQYNGIGIGRNTQTKECGIAIGKDANAVLDGVAIGGGGPDAHDYGTAIGYNSKGYNKGVAVGDGAEANDMGVALGYATRTKDNTASIAIGYRSKNYRDAELALNIGDEVTNDITKCYQQIVIGSWVRNTTDTTSTIMRCNGTAGSRFIIRPQSALTFKIMVTARDNTSGDCAAYLFDGLIKRDGANNTILCVCNKTILHEDDATWDCDVAVDDANEALQITVTGDADNNVKWAARLDGIETSFTAIPS